MTSTDRKAAVLVPTASEAEWLAARRGGVTASEIAVLMGLSPYSSPYALYHQKLGILPEVEETDAMALGKHMESYVAAKFAERRPEFYITSDGRALYAHPDRPWQMATPDRLVHEDGTGYLRFPPAVAVLECKIDGGSPDWGDEGTDQIPVHYRAQVLWQMDVLGVQTGYVACLLWNRRKVQVYELTMDGDAQRDLSLMRHEAILFLDRIKRGDPPEVDWRPATRDALRALHPDLDRDREVLIGHQLATRYQAACRDVKAAERRKATYENKIRALLGTGNYAVDAKPPNVTVARRDVYDLPEKTITRKASTVDRLVPVKPREATP